jgi:hypothetical protein
MGWQEWLIFLQSTLRGTDNQKKREKNVKSLMMIRRLRPFGKLRMSITARNYILRHDAFEEHLTEKSF